MAFNEGFRLAKDAIDATAADISRKTGVPKNLIDKICQAKTKSTNVDDAIKLARYFGKTVEEISALSRDGKISEIMAAVPSLGDDDLLAIFDQYISKAQRKTKAN